MKSTMLSKSCGCESASDTLVLDDTATIGLLGNPNSGKSTLFNAMTGAQRSVGNWPGTTVEIGRGSAKLPGGHKVRVLDLPGAYSLDAHAPDEELTRDLILTSERPELVVILVDATSLERGLFLVSELREHRCRLLVVVTMTDVAAKRGLTIDTDALAVKIGVPVVAIDPRRREEAGPLMDAAEAALLATLPEDLPAGPADEDPLAREERRFAWIQDAARAAMVSPETARVTWSDRVDRIVTAPVLGMFVFLAVMWLIFQATTTLAVPLQDALDSYVVVPASDLTQQGFDAVGLGASPVAGFLVNGLIAGVGTVLTFVPLMAIMFVLLALLEDSGYLARAAMVTDRLMRRIGLPGKAFIPLIVGFGCNVPAISGVRVLSDAKHRLLTALLIPFTSCSARLTVYVMVAAAFFGSNAGTVVFLMYVISVVLIVLVGYALRKTLIRAMGSEPLIIDLPAYHRPTLRLVWSVTWVRLRAFLKTASGIIVTTVIVVWVLSSVPAVAGYSFADVPVQDSAYARAADTVAPVFAPAGFGEWHAASALMTGFVAKEAVISSWAQTYSVTEPEDPADPGTLGDQVRASFDASSGGHGSAAALAFLVFLLAYTPCMATVGTQRREIGWRWTLTGMAIQLAVAWTLAVAVFQIARAIGS
ncbi:MAG: ferrous iron transport protein B [Candidatus Nanopelagicales bacterium]|nr:ferrous iron transport protein B [Candidatus Nanopelagicales bacterium]MDZ4248762.1 ferrous iron transport protein B [Candidatus Nanopelagicales bacterium]